MPGFILIDDDSQVNESFNTIISGEDIKIFSTNKYHIEAVSNSKFENDKVYHEDNNYILILDGIILNKADLINSLTQDWPSFLISLYQENGNEFFTKLSGSYVGLLINKRKSECIVLQIPLEANQYSYQP